MQARNARCNAAGVSFWRRSLTVVRGTTQEAKTSNQNSSTRDLKIDVNLVVELSADVPTFRELGGSACAPGGRVDSKSRSVHRHLLAYRTRRRLWRITMKIQRRQFLHLAAGIGALPALSPNANAQTYPSRPIHLIVGFTPGAASDIIGRVFAKGAGSHTRSRSRGRE
jgi:hypothetical protein